MTSFDVNKTIQRATAKLLQCTDYISLWWKNAEDLSEIKSADTKSEIKSKGVAVDTKKIPKKVSPKTPKKVVLQDIPKEKMEEMLNYVAKNKHLDSTNLTSRHATT